MSALDELADSLLGLFSEPPTSILSSVLVRLAEVLREDMTLLPAVEDMVQDAHRAVRVELPSHQHAFVMILSLPEMRHPEKVVSTWTELALQAVLKHTRLDSETVDAAKELVVDSLSGHEDTSYVMDYRKRVFQLYLLDALSDASGPDAVESAAMEEVEKESKKAWKANLGDILIAFALRRPSHFCHAANEAFGYPNSRLELLNLFQRLVTNDKLDFVSFASSDLLSSILLSLTVDNSTSCFTLGISVIVAIMPQLAAASHEVLSQRLPSLLVILARALSSNGLQRSDDASTRAVQNEDEDLGSSWPDNTGIHFQRKSLAVDPELHWQRLEPSFVPISSRLPSADHFFTFLYGIFPCNTMEFLRHPLEYVEGQQLPCPFSAGWSEVLNDDEIRQRGSALAYRHTLSPSLFKYDITTELSDHTQWSDREVSSIIAQVVSLDSACASAPFGPPRFSNAQDNEADDLDADPNAQIVDFTVPHRPRISVRNMIAATMALKSSAEIEIVDYPLHWPAEIFAASTASRTSRSASVGSYARSLSAPDAVDAPPDTASIAANSSDSGGDLPTRALQAVAILQRECLLLRNELNYQLWLKRSLLHNVSRLQRERNISIHGELERQNLRDKGKEYQAQKEELQTQLKKERTSLALAQKNYREEADLHNAKRKELRDKKKEWDEQTATLLQTNKENEARLRAQSERLAQSMQRIFELESQIKETAPLIDRLEDYKTRIEQHTQMQKLWDEDVQRYKTQNAQIEVMVSNYKKKEELLASAQAANKSLLDERILSLNKIASLERKLNEQTSVAGSPSRTSTIPSPAHQIVDLAKELSDSKAACRRLRAENAQLRDQLEETESLREFSRAPSLLSSDAVER